MVNLGKYNLLEVVKTVDFGIYMDGGDGVEILMPTRYVPEGALPGDKINCFIYLDSEDRLLATTETPYAQVGEFALLKVKQNNNVGAFLDWGVSKELLVPFREQRVDMEVGRSYLVHIYVDEVSDRIAGSAKLNKFLDNVPAEYETNEEVELIIAKKTDIGYKVIVNNQHSGLIYHNQIFKTLSIGDKVKGYVKEIRGDGKIDLMLQPIGYKKIVGSVEDRILEELEINGGTMQYNDKTDSETIMEVFECSKKNFKKAIGALYKKGIISIEDNGIVLNEGK